MKARLCVALLIMGVSPLAVAQRAGPAQSQQQFDEVAAADQALFSAFFDRCDVDALSKMVTDDLECSTTRTGT
jgi:hypothetical protein